MGLQNLMKFHQRFLKLLRKQNVTDTRTHTHTHGRKDGQRENSIPTHKHSLRGYNHWNGRKLEEAESFKSDFVVYCLFEIKIG